MKKKIIIAGHGGQGIVVAGSLIANAAMDSGLNVCGMVSYGVEMRGGTARSMVIISEKEISSPIIDSPDICMIMNQESYDKYSTMVSDLGVMIINSSLVKHEKREGAVAVLVPMTELAKKIGDPRAANIIGVGACIKATGILTIDAVKKALPKVLKFKSQIIPINENALMEGYSHA